MYLKGMAKYFVASKVSPEEEKVCERQIKPENSFHLQYGS